MLLPLGKLMLVHSACVMNVISFEKAYCLYPRSTLHHRRSVRCYTASHGDEQLEAALERCRDALEESVRDVERHAKKISEWEKNNEEEKERVSELEQTNRTNEGTMRELEEAKAVSELRLQQAEQLAKIYEERIRVLEGMVAEFERLRDELLVKEKVLASPEAVKEEDIEPEQKYTVCEFVEGGKRCLKMFLSDDVGFSFVPLL